jgi:PII-like signaling protein
MLSKGAAKKVTIYVNEDAKFRHEPLHEAVLAFLLHRGVAGASASRCIAGFGVHQQMHTPKIEALSEHLSIRIEFIETPERVDALLPALYDMVTDGLIEVQDTTIVKIARKDRPGPAPTRIQQRGVAKMLRVFLGEADQSEGEPLYEAIVKRLRMLEIAGATVYRGILGYGAKGHTHRSGFFHISKDLPVMISVIDSPEKIAEATAAIETMLEDGLIVLSDVEYVRIVHAAGTDDASV